VKIKTIRESYSEEYKISQSRFIGHLIPTKTLSKFKEHLVELKIAHPKATHICYAYRIGFQNEDIRSNDDGEPSGTAGKPILNQLYSYNLQNVSLFVVRYYGGTKLGVPGLIEAYKNTANLCLNRADIIEEEEEREIQIALHLNEYYEVIKYLKNNNLNIINSSFNEDRYDLSIQVPISKLDFFRDWLHEK